MSGTFNRPPPLERLSQIQGQVEGVFMRIGELAAVRVPPGRGSVPEASAIGYAARPRCPGPPMGPKTHWEAVYEAKAPDAVSWYAPHLRESMSYIRRTNLPASTAIIDVGGGESTLVDDLLDAGYGNVTVLDISDKALAVAKERVAERACRVHWLVTDVLEAPLPEQAFDVWHDRAVFHFLTDAKQRQAYVAQVMRAVRPGGYAIVGTFGPLGPSQCSGLPVARYAPDELHGEFGGSFALVDNSIDVHTTPWGSTQQFVYCFCRLAH